MTNAQYTDFLNSVGAGPNSLYSVSMATEDRGGITRSGAPGSYTYAVRTNMGDKPVNFVSWFDAVRFCNWLHNDRPSGAQSAATTEDGAYTFNDRALQPGTDSAHGANGRNAGARFHLPGHSEWYKAAYHQPAEEGGDTDSFWRYPTGSNAVPTIATADATGNIDNDTSNIANYRHGAKWNRVSGGNLTTVGSGGPGSASFYGAFDMGGNVVEWTEQTISIGNQFQGGSWGTPSDFLAPMVGPLD